MVPMLVSGEAFMDGPVLKGLSVASSFMLAASSNALTIGLGTFAKVSVGVGNVDNAADAAKIVSGPTQIESTRSMSSRRIEKTRT